MESQNEILAKLSDLVDRVKSGEVVGITVVTTTSAGKVDIETICYPPSR